MGYLDPPKRVNPYEVPPPPPPPIIHHSDATRGWHGFGWWMTACGHLVRFKRRTSYPGVVTCHACRVATGMERP